MKLAVKNEIHSKENVQCTEPDLHMNYVCRHGKVQTTLEMTLKEQIPYKNIKRLSMGWSIKKINSMRVNP